MPGLIENSIFKWGLKLRIFIVFPQKPQSDHPMDTKVWTRVIVFSGRAVFRK